jgi:hypothetical protein
MSKRFNIGALTATAGVHEVMSNNQAFKKFVNQSLERYFVGDWGDTDEEDAKQNDEAADGAAEFCCASMSVVSYDNVVVFGEEHQNNPESSFDEILNDLNIARK